MKAWEMRPADKGNVKPIYEIISTRWKFITLKFVRYGNFKIYLHCITSSSVYRPLGSQNRSD